MLPLPSDAEPRFPEDFAPLLATIEPVLLVGGQAVNVWAMYYESRTTKTVFEKLSLDASQLFAGLGHAKLSKLRSLLEKRLPRAIENQAN